ncbi:hypothetical protein BV22DRAFT_1197250 [Leucogyrophana mollusca]|uniref:Uncharacterized protein n=1 Tax=Leucogyrophana mollusca TaxID=85980 RepID=A0ACB8BAH7_9AGAM|nr:hypothetical protein BV22DRAFT_1197250 [Leucogyrophana mollusca]
MSTLHISRLALTHAVLAYSSPELTALDAISTTHLPPEIVALIRTHLVASLSHGLLASLNTSLAAAVDALCAECTQFNVHVYGEHVLDWPRLEPDGCRCAEVGRSPTATALKHQSLCDDENGRYVPVAESDPPPWFQAHTHSAVSATSHSGIDALISAVLLEFGCALVPSKHSPSYLEDVICITSLSAHPISPLLSLALGLDTHKCILENSAIHPRHYTCPKSPPVTNSTPHSRGLSFPSALTGILWIAALAVLSLHTARLV